MEGLKAKFRDMGTGKFSEKYSRLKNESADSSRCADVIGSRNNEQPGVCCPIP